MTTLIVILLGAGLGAMPTGLWAWYLFVTREQRRVRDPWILTLGYLQGFVLVSSLLLLITILKEFGIERHSFQSRASIISYLAGIRWRMSIGFDDKTLFAKPKR